MRQLSGPAREAGRSSRGITREGAAVLAVSIDTPQAQARMESELKLPFPLLSDPRMEAIRAYGMKGEGMEMADMGYVVIDKQGAIRTRHVDRRFGENVATIARAVHAAKSG